MTTTKENTVSVDALMEASALQRIAESYLDWSKLNGFHADVTDSRSESPVTCTLGVWHDFAPRETRVTRVIDKREIAGQRSPERVVRFVYAKVDEALRECIDILEQIKYRDRSIANGGYGEFAFDFLSGNSLVAQRAAAEQLGMAPKLTVEYLPPAFARLVSYKIGVDVAADVKPSSPPKRPGHSELTRELDIE